MGRIFAILFTVFVLALMSPCATKDTAMATESLATKQKANKAPVTSDNATDDKVTGDIGSGYTASDNIKTKTTVTNTSGTDKTCTDSTRTNNTDIDNTDTNTTDTNTTDTNTTDTHTADTHTTDTNTTDTNTTDTHTTDTNTTDTHTADIHTADINTTDTHTTDTNTTDTHTTDTNTTDTHTTDTNTTDTNTADTHTADTHTADTNTTDTHTTDTNTTDTHNSVNHNTDTEPPVTLAPKYPVHEPSQTEFSIPLKVFVCGNFSDDLENGNSSEYSNYSNAFNKSLTEFYNALDIPGFNGVTIINFFEGSIGCNFSLIIKPSTALNVSAINSTLQLANYSTFSVKVENLTLSVEINQTKKAIGVALANTFNDPCKGFKAHCSDNDEVCVVDTDEILCSHKCNTNNICSNNGECFVDTTGTVKCRCREDSMYVYKGDTCREKVIVFFSGRNTTIIGATAGSIIACLLLLVIYLVVRWRHKRTRKANDKHLTDLEEIRKNNSQIENITMDVGGLNNPMYHPYNGNYQQIEHGDNLNGKRSDRDNLYQDVLEYNEGRYYRVLDDPKSRSKVLVYQPSTTSSPENRTESTSWFDDSDFKAPSYNRRPDMEHQSFRDSVNTEQQYAIRRPQLMRNGYR